MYFITKVFFFFSLALVKDKIISMNMKQLEAKAVGEYNCEMKIFDNIVSQTKIIISAHIRLTSKITQYTYVLCVVVSTGTAQSSSLLSLV